MVLQYAPVWSSIVVLLLRAKTVYWSTVYCFSTTASTENNDLQKSFSVVANFLHRRDTPITTTTRYSSAYGNCSHSLRSLSVSTRSIDFKMEVAAVGAATSFSLADVNFDDNATKEGSQFTCVGLMTLILAGGAGMLYVYVLTCLETSVPNSHCCLFAKLRLLLSQWLSHPRILLL